MSQRGFSEQIENDFHLGSQNRIRSILVFIEKICKKCEVPQFNYLMRLDRAGGCIISQK